MSNCNFSFDHYTEILKQIENNKYNTIFFDEIDSYDKEVLLRHDVDQSLENAYDMSKIENKFGIKSTYFLWLRSPFYNVFDNKYTQIIKVILDLGHQIGLHFDESFYDIKSKNDINKYIDTEIKILESFFQTKICTVSFHRPSKFVLDENISLNHVINTYDDIFFKQIKYISDSRMIWKEGCACKHIESGKYKKIQILMHPIWWGVKNLSSKNVLEGFIERKTRKIDMELSKNIQIYKSIY